MNLLDSPPLLFGIAAVCFYAATRVGMIRTSGVGGRAIAHWLPVAGVAVLAARDHRSLAIGIIFASSVAALYLAMGTAIFSSPDHLSMNSPHRRGWGMILPLAMLAMLCGFSAHLTMLHAAMFVVQGALAWMLWNSGETSDDESRADSDVSWWLTIIAIIGALALAFVGGAVAIRAAAVTADRTQRLGEGLIGALMIAPALALPILGTGLNIARGEGPRAGDGRGAAGELISFCVACVILNLGLLLPVVILIGHVAAAWNSGWRDVAHSASWLWTKFDPPAVPFPITVWRVDTIALVLIGALLLPLSAGRWPIRKLDGGVLLLAYAVYILVTASAAVR